MAKYKFSLVIAIAPNRNAEVISSLEKADYSKKYYEVIIQKGTNPSENRNEGAKKSKGEIIGFIDDDAVIDPLILKKVENFFKENKGIDIVGGPQLTPSEQRGFAKISGYALSSKFGAWNVSNRYSGEKVILNADETMVSSANLFCRKDVFKKIRFNPDFYPGEDPEFIKEALRCGLKVAFSPEIIVYHKRRESILGLSKQVFNYGRVRPKKDTLLETLRFPFFLIPACFVLYIMGLFWLGNWNILFIIPLGLYVLLAILTSLWIAIKKKEFSTFITLPLVYLLIHINYGLGIILGFIEKIFIKIKKNL